MAKKENYKCVRIDMRMVNAVMSDDSISANTRPLQRRLDEVLRRLYENSPNTPPERIS